jgi:hypothetical protein
MLLSIAQLALSQETAHPMSQVSRDAVSTPTSSPFRIALSNETKPKVMDGKFLLLAGMASAATFADIATTNRCLSSSVNCQESNPLLGSHPSSGKVYGISLSVLAGQMLAVDDFADCGDGGAWNSRCPERPPYSAAQCDPIAMIEAGWGASCSGCFRCLWRVAWRPRRPH